MRRRVSVLLCALLTGVAAFSVLPAAALASKAITHNASHIRLRVDRAGVALVQYTDRRGRSKRVTYFAMTPNDVAPRDADDEVDIVAWWPVATAAAALTYPHDRDLVTEHTA